MKVQVALNSRVHLVPYHIDGGQPSYFIIAGLVFTPLSEPLIDEECEDSIGLKLLAKARHSLARFKGEQIVILSQVAFTFCPKSGSNLFIDLILVYHWH
uniref:Putative DegP2 protease family protein n=1 Tax=Rhizophora mucronata TaxID=61149 RepID=A0A2P2MQ27_RHIMU